MLLVLEEGASVHLVEDYFDGIAPPGRNISIHTSSELILKRASHLMHTSCYHGNQPGCSVLAGRYVHQQRESKYNLVESLLRNSFTHVNHYADLLGEEAIHQTHALYLANSYMGFHPTYNHLNPRTYSKNLFRGVAAKSGRVLLQGIANIQPSAIHSNVKQDYRGIVLNHGGSIHPIPKLAIFADCVQASHAVGIGPLDRLAIDYMAARGIKTAEAELLLLEAQISEVINSVNEKQIVQNLYRLASNRLLEMTEALPHC